MTAPPPVPPGSGTGAVLARLGRPYDPARAAAALLGLPHGAGRQLVGTAVATSEEAVALLGAMPRILRSLCIATTDRPERLQGELRGPVLWSETMSARSASAGAPDLFVCATTTRAYDTDENRLLKAALHRIERAGIEAAFGTDDHGDDAVHEARRNGHLARRVLAHRTMSGVPLVRVSGRALRRTRAGRRASTYRPALDLLARALEPLAASHLQAYATRATSADHDLLATALINLEALTAGRVALQVSGDRVLAGPISYQHAQGVSIGGVRVNASEAIPRALRLATA